jgi:hypothetical protein
MATNKVVYKRLVKAVLHRLTTDGNSSTIISTRFFTSTQTAIRRGTELAVMEGEPGDVLEISHSNLEYLIATIKLKAGKTHFADMQIEFHLNKFDKKVK